MKKIFAVFLALTLMIILSTVLYLPALAAEGTASAQQTPANEPYNPDTDIVVKVNDYEINYTHLQIAIKNMKARMSYHKSISERRYKQIEKAALDKIILDQLLFEEALNRSIVVTPREIKKAIRKFQNNLPKGKTLSKVLKQSNMNKADLKAVFKQLTLLAKLKTETDKETNKKLKKLINDKFMKEHYDENLVKFTEPEKIHLSEILLRADPIDTKAHWFDVRDKAIKTVARIRGGEDFAEVAKEVSQDSYASNGGDIGWSHSNTIDGGLANEAIKLKDGEISDPIESIYGYYIIKVHERIPPELKKYKDLDHEKLKDELMKSNFLIIEKEWFDSLIEKAEIVYLDAK